MKRDNIMHARIITDLGDQKGEYGITNRPVEKPYTLKSRGGVTIAVLLNDDNTLSWGFSRCYKKDVYSRKIGRYIALGRAKTHKVKTENYEFEDVKQLSLRFAQDIYDYKVKICEITSELIKNTLSGSELAIKN